MSELMKPKRRGRPKLTGSNKKKQFNIRLPQKLAVLLSDEMEGREGVLISFFRKSWPAGWSFHDEPESPTKKDRLDYGKRSKRSSQTWTNSSIIMHMLDDYMKYACLQNPDLVLQHSQYIPISYVELAIKHRNRKEEEEEEE